MPIPWLTALKIIPWGTILDNAPALARSAEQLLLGTKARRVPPASVSDLQSAVARIEVLERRDQETAQLLADLSAQMAAMAIATEVLQARGRWLLALCLALTVSVAVLAGAMVFGR
jgi:hypothetical protein